MHWAKFAVKEAKFGMQNFVGEFSKQTDPKLSFSYICLHTLGIIKALTLNLTKHLKERQRRNMSLEEVVSLPLF